MGVHGYEKMVFSLQEKLNKIKNKLDIVKAEHQAMKGILKNLNEVKIEGLNDEDLRKFVGVLSKMSALTLQVIEQNKERTK